MLLFFSLLLASFHFYFLFMTFYLFKFGSLIYSLDLIPWGNLKLDWMFIFDIYSSGFFSIISLISFSIMIYSYFYMSKETNIKRFSMLVFLFVMSMGILTISPNLLSLMLGWDGLGLVSFLLVSYYDSVKSMTASLITIYLNRIGDVFILFALFNMIMIKSWDLNSLSNHLTLTMAFLILAGMTKSAQIPFSVWLPAAMAAPTPVSSLVHSSTLVTAGIYLLIRFNNFLYEIASTMVLLWVGGLTMLLSGTLACLEKDMKKVIAMSTLSQLGLMMFMLSCNYWKFTFFHMITHALFKSMLFLCCGVLLIFGFGNQDIRWSGGTSQSILIFGVMFLFSSLSLMGFPFLSGFYSKDMLLDSSFQNDFSPSTHTILFWSCCLTSIYSMRLIFNAFMEKSKTHNMPHLNSKFPLMPLSFLFFYALKVSQIMMNYYFITEDFNLNGKDKMMEIMLMPTALLFCLLCLYFSLNSKGDSIPDFMYLYWMGIKPPLPILKFMMNPSKGDLIYIEKIPKINYNILSSISTSFLKSNSFSYFTMIMLSLCWFLLIFILLPN